MDAAALIDPVLIALAAILIALIPLIMTIVLAVRQRNLLKRYRMLLNGTEGKDLEQLLLTQGDRIDQVEAGLATLKADEEALANDAKFHIQKTGTVRFSAFPDMGSDLSFAIALLDANNNGLVLSSLYGRSESRTYAKPIQNGTSTYQLSDEEKQAIAQALGLEKVEIRAKRA